MENNKEQSFGTYQGDKSNNNTGTNSPLAANEKKPKRTSKAAIVIAIIVGMIAILTVSCVGCVGCAASTASIFMSNDFMDTSYEYSSGEEYIGVIYVEGAISESASYDSYYNHVDTLNNIDYMISDSSNEGLIVYVNTPGGTVYASDELYLKIKEYQGKTGRPVYTYMASQATSGGYYIAAPTDKIIANRNCWTGSIGVTIGTFYDVSEFLSNAGVKTVTITSGDNKAMGSTTEPMTSEQRAIFQSLVDEAYYQFVEIVAEGRDLTMAQATGLADGRIYTAAQAQEVGLVDEIATFEEAMDIMVADEDLEHCEIISFESEGLGLLEQLFAYVEGLAKNEGVQSQYGEVMNIIENGTTFNVTYMSEIKK